MLLLAPKGKFAISMIILLVLTKVTWISLFVRETRARWHIRSSRCAYLLVVILVVIVVVVVGGGGKTSPLVIGDGVNIFQLVIDEGGRKIGQIRLLLVS